MDTLLVFKEIRPPYHPAVTFDKEYVNRREQNGFFDDLVEKAAGASKSSQGQQEGLVEGVIGLLTNKETGGLGGLIEAFNQKGLGDLISSWVGTGNNAAITPEQIREVLGSDVIQLRKRYDLGLSKIL